MLALLLKLTEIEKPRVCDRRCFAALEKTPEWPNLKENGTIVLKSKQKRENWSALFSEAAGLSRGRRRHFRRIDFEMCLSLIHI